MLQLFAILRYALHGFLDVVFYFSVKRRVMRAHTAKIRESLLVQNLVSLHFKSVHLHDNLGFCKRELTLCCARHNGCENKERNNTY